MKIVTIPAAAGVALILAACAQQEEPMVRPQPVFDKSGQGSCEGEWIYVPGTVPELAECVPPEECEPVYDTAGNLIDCLPPNRRDPGGNGGSGSASRPPVGTAPVGGLTAVTGGTGAPPT